MLLARQRALTVAAVLLLVAASLHCPLEWQAAIGQIAEIGRLRAAGEALPIGMPLPGCEDESGCICRGATLTQAVDVSCLASDAADWLPLGLPLLPRAKATAENDDRPAFAGECLAPPFSGRQLRALYASLVI
jgi:hypothetical protein